MDPVKDIWDRGDFDPPSILFAINRETQEQFLVLDDVSTIVRLMNNKGQIFVVAGFRCELKTAPNGREYYSCETPIHPVTCSKITNPRDKFALEKLKPVVFP